MILDTLAEAFQDDYDMDGTADSPCLTGKRGTQSKLQSRLQSCFFFFADLAFLSLNFSSREVVNSTRHDVLKS